MGGRCAFPVWNGRKAGWAASAAWVSVYPGDVGTGKLGEFCEICINAPTFLAWRMESRGTREGTRRPPEALRPSCEMEVAVEALGVGFVQEARGCPCVWCTSLER